ncbi:peptidoglycan/LPS O-acetylase OafA/YrhL [Sphaerotilus hippei]|uniref:Peptidoglycan/LPS O-acetylase OafA/YrhL n=1 Tax=Sphaerotilus hippei TaxID=744406 RepID=A0A318HBA9_9BURK|nr:acyltransferase [Sphaerotilus hippei]PXW97999.1 peptidoglycan/LPS O-acetylase OafA/YrhL [Sphaerotilus hippei]
MAAPQRWDEIDLLRGLACLSVVGFHFFWRGQSADWITPHAPAWLEAIARYGDMGVSLFFMISGFVISLSARHRTVRQFVASRVARLYPALWVAAPLTAATAWLAHDGRFTVEGSTLLLNLTMVPQYFGVDFVDGAYWSLAVELQFYLLVVIALALGLMQRVEWLVGGWLLLSIVDLLRPVWPLEFWLAVHWAPLFGAGMLACQIRREGPSLDRWLLYAACWILALLFAWRADTDAPGPAGHAHDPWIGLALLSGFFVLFIAIALDRWQLRASRLTRWAGLLTYPVYLLHQNIGYLAIEGLNRIGLDLVPAALLTTTAVGLLAVLVHRLVEQPLSLRLRRTLEGRRAAA